MTTPVFYTRKLPHWQPPGKTFFITYRLAGSLPGDLIQQLKENYLKEKLHPNNQSPEKKEKVRSDYFLAFENEMDKSLNEPHWLKDERIAKVVLDSLFFNDQKAYSLIAACLMSNHVHILISLCPDAPMLNVILQNHKKFTAVQCNKILNRTGKFWAEESFDTIIRNEKHYYNTVSYIIQNPVKAGLITNWYDWKWTYLEPTLLKEYRLV